MRRLAIRFVGALAVCSLITAGAVAVAARRVDQLVATIPHVAVDVSQAAPQGANYLIVGSDSRQWVQDDADRAAFGDATSEGGRRSDTIMVAHIEPDSSQAYVVSFPRDLWVNVPGTGAAKLNAAYNDGPQALVDTLRGAFAVDINHYVEVDFPTFVSVVDKLGQVPVYIPYPARDSFTGLDVTTPGCVALDGPGALSWVRSRHLEYQNPETGRWSVVDPVPDIGRIARQQAFVRTVIDLAVAQSLADPRNALGVMQQIAGGLRTDPSFDAQSLGQLFTAFRTSDPEDPATLSFTTLPWHTGAMQSGQSVLYVDEEPAEAVLARLRTFGTPQRRSEADPLAVGRIRVVNASGHERLGQAVSRRLRQLGVRVADVQDAPRRAKATTVRAGVGALNSARALLKLLDPATAVVADAPVAPTRQRRGALSQPVAVELVLGRDFTSLRVADAPPSAGDPSAAVGDTGAAGDSTAATAEDSAGADMAAPGSDDLSRFGPAAPRQGC